MGGVETVGEEVRVGVRGTAHGLLARGGPLAALARACLVGARRKAIFTVHRASIRTRPESTMKSNAPERSHAPSMSMAEMARA
jgi:hypothetical protein